MSQRIYLTDPTCEQFAGKVVSRREEDGSWWLELDRTCFYVEGGGQPSDAGTIGAANVLRVFEHEGHVWHVVDRPVPENDVIGRVNMAVRHDYSVQHTGQHILSQAYWRLFAAATSSFHLTDKSVSIDLSLGDMTEAQIAAGEALANEIIRRGLPIGTSFHDDRETLPEELRKSPVVKGPIRLVSVGDFDMCPCGGTHVATTAEVQFIKVLATERTRGRTRVIFVCGERALREYARRIASDNVLAQMLSAPYAEQPEAIERLLTTEKELRRERTRLSRELMEYRAVSASPHSTFTWGTYFEFPEWNEEMDDAKYLLAAISRMRRPAVAVLVMPQDPARIFISSSSALEAGAMLRQLYAKYDGKGGGNAHAAQGSLPAAQVQDALETLRETLSQ